MQPINVGQCCELYRCRACADVALGPIVLALIRFGATFKEFPNLAKYAETIKVRAGCSMLLTCRTAAPICCCWDLCLLSSC